MSYKVSMNTELVDTESLLLVEFKDRFLWTSGHDIFINSPIYNLVSSVFLFSLKKKNSLFNMYCWFIPLNSWPAALWLRPGWCLANTCISLQVTSQPCAWNTMLQQTSTSSLCWGALILNSEISNKNHKFAIHVALNRLWKGHLLPVSELKPEGRAEPGVTSGSCASVIPIFCFSVHV